MSLRCFFVFVAVFFYWTPLHSVCASDLFDLFMSPSDEARIGQEEHPKILAEFGGEYADPKIVAYVNSIGQFLLQTSETPKARFTFTVLNSPVVNAFALPGGYVYVTRGLLALAGSEAELAGVIAHEVGHVTARHSANRAGNSILANLGLTVLGIVTGNEIVSKVGQLGAFAVLQSHSREDEFEADQRGVRYLMRAGFDPHAMSSFLRKLQAHSHLEAKIQGVSPNEGFDFFATHPRTSERVKRAIQLASDGKVQRPIVGRDVYFTKIDGLLFGNDESQGFIQDQRFVHPILRFEFVVPKGFNILNGQRSVVAKGPNGSTLQFDFAERSKRSIERYLRDDWARGKGLSDVEILTIGGMPSATAVLHPSGGRGDVTIRLVAIGFDSRTVYRFIFVTPRRLSKEERRTIEHTALTFRRLNEIEARSTTPQRLGFHRVVAEDTPETISKRMAVASFKLERFRTLNGLSLKQDLTVGERVKVVLK